MNLSVLGDSSIQWGFWGPNEVGLLWVNIWVGQLFVKQLEGERSMRQLHWGVHFQCSILSHRWSHHGGGGMWGCWWRVCRFECRWGRLLCTRDLWTYVFVCPELSIERNIVRKIENKISRKIWGMVSRISFGIWSCPRVFTFGKVLKAIVINCACKLGWDWRWMRASIFKCELVAACHRYCITAHIRVLEWFVMYELSSVWCWMGRVCE